ncbi:MAG: lipoyl(octanoyl) transferase LipB [Alphaproteobacteria bacterium]|nr:lipoyl(octanoyl) transferase LipB [Alphaproteobacteria bacterium]
MTSPPLPWEWWGQGVPYGWAWARQKARRQGVIEGRAGECLALLEHRAVVTFGRRPAPGNPSPEALEAMGLEVFHTERGGLATWHGPGQLVGYLILDLRRRRLKVRVAVEAIEQGLIDWLRPHGVDAGRRAGWPGVWVGVDKIGALGLNIHRDVTMHGFALNLRVASEAFGAIVPCGVTDGGVTSLDRLVADAPGPVNAAPSVAEAVTRSLESAAEP